MNALVRILFLKDCLLGARELSPVFSSERPSALYGSGTIVDTRLRIRLP